MYAGLWRDKQAVNGFFAAVKEKDAARFRCADLNFLAPWPRYSSNILPELKLSENPPELELSNRLELSDSPQKWPPMSNVEFIMFRPVDGFMPWSLSSKSDDESRVMSYSVSDEIEAELSVPDARNMSKSLLKNPISLLSPM